MKNIISIFLSIMLLLSIFSVDAYALEKKNVSSGTCGENVTWELDNMGTLTIAGMGDMEDFSMTNTPWANNDVRKLVIEEGVTNIGEYAFYDCFNMTHALIPDSVTSIGESAFSFCESLIRIVVPDNVKVIESKAFSSCYGLKEVTLPKSLQSIEDYTFHYCDSLERINIPSSVTHIGEWAFSHCDSLTGITIPAGVTCIGTGAFLGCDSLKSIVIPSNVIYLGDYAFEVCDSLTDVEIWGDIGTIGKKVFCDCKSLTNVYINSATSIGVSAFSGCNSLTNVVLPNNLEIICGDAFFYCFSLKSITIPKSVAIIKRGAMDSVENVCFPGTEEEWKEISVAEYNFDEAIFYFHDNKPMGGKPINAKVATYTQYGYTGDKYCPSCKTIIQRGKNIAVKQLSKPQITFKGQKKKIKVQYKKITAATGFVVSYRKTGTKKWITKTYIATNNATKTIKKLSKGKYKIKAYAFVTEGKKTAKSNVVTKTIKVK